MTPDEVRELYDYNSWANRRVMDACAPLSAEQFTRNLGSSFPSVRDTLQHIMFAEWVWLERWQGRMPARIPSDDFADLSALRARWAPIESGFFDFVRALTPGELDRTLEYRNTKGVALSNRVREILRHVVNHGTYHRGQVATMLRQLGAAPTATDLIVFYRERSASRSS